ncbi:hypothetical protein SAMN02745134_00626 [Clostridium acidisoli DSM 12555]|uniref:Uncharacterized protein n=2 Tax=Clostridium TaxID=1485 RepID=A0A1W1X413_9CLOT|nr:hypothetical protein SAMN02745134_00626 [Clostridium acidisoli DSM 12555]
MLQTKIKVKIVKIVSSLAISTVMACSISTTASAQSTTTSSSYGISLSNSSNFYGYNSLVNRPYTDGQSAYNYSVDIVKTGEDTGQRYRAFTGGRWKTSTGDGDHVLQWTTPNGQPGTWSMWSNAPEFYLGKETGNSNSWYSGNTLEPDVLTAPNTPWLMYTQVEIDPGQPTDTYGVNANTQADRIMLLTSSDCKNWTRKSDRGVITDIPDPANTFFHHEAVIYVPDDPVGKYWMYVCVAINGQNNGYYRIRSNDYTTFDFAKREQSNMGDLGAKIGYLKQAPGGPLYVRIPTVQSGSGRTVPAFQFSRDGLNWDSNNNLLLEGSTDNTNNKNSYFSGVSTINGTGEIEYAGNYQWKGLYATSTSNSPTSPDIFKSEIGYGTFTLNMNNRAITQIDYPQQTTYSSSSDIPVTGWGVSFGGTQRVDIYIDNIGLTSITSLVNRPDVQQIINTNNLYSNAANSGYATVIKAGTLSKGTHTIEVAGISLDGSVCWQTRNFTVN